MLPKFFKMVPSVTNIIMQEFWMTHAHCLVTMISFCFCFCFYLNVLKVIFRVGMILCGFYIIVINKGFYCKIIDCKCVTWVCQVHLLLFLLPFFKFQSVCFIIVMKMIGFRSMGLFIPDQIMVIAQTHVKHNIYIYIVTQCPWRYSGVTCVFFIQIHNRA